MLERRLRTTSNTTSNTTKGVIRGGAYAEEKSVSVDEVDVYGEAGGEEEGGWTPPRTQNTREKRRLQTPQLQLQPRPLPPPQQPPQPAHRQHPRQRRDGQDEAAEEEDEDEEEEEGGSTANNSAAQSHVSSANHSANHSANNSVNGLHSTGMSAVDDGWFFWMIALIVAFLCYVD